jgi:hypothetical protein
VLLQPGNNDALTQALQDYWDGKGFSFMTKESSATLHPICFGARKCRGNKVRLHSHLGKCFAGDYAINKMRHYVSGERFVWVTDCYAIKFLLSYKGCNPAILCLQMRLMCWDVDIIHRPDLQLVNADYWSCLGAIILTTRPSSGSLIQPRQTFQCIQKICPTTAAPAFSQLQILPKPRTRYTFRAYLLT